MRMHRHVNGMYTASATIVSTKFVDELGHGLCSVGGMSRIPFQQSQRAIRDELFHAGQFDVQVLRSE